jgi:hypothetical protein
MQNRFGLAGAIFCAAAAFAAAGVVRAAAVTAGVYSPTYSQSISGTFNSPTLNATTNMGQSESTASPAPGGVPPTDVSITNAPSPPPSGFAPPPNHPDSTADAQYYAQTDTSGTGLYSAATATAGGSFNLSAGQSGSFNQNVVSNVVESGNFANPNNYAVEITYSLQGNVSGPNLSSTADGYGMVTFALPGGNSTSFTFNDPGGSYTESSSGAGVGTSVLPISGLDYNFTITIPANEVLILSQGAYTNSNYSDSVTGPSNEPADTQSASATLSGFVAPSAGAPPAVPTPAAAGIAASGLALLLGAGLKRRRLA